MPGCLVLSLQIKATAVITDGENNGRFLFLQPQNTSLALAWRATLAIASWAVKKIALATGVGIASKTVIRYIKGGLHHRVGLKLTGQPGQALLQISPEAMGRKSKIKLRISRMVLLRASMA
jgi:hypothetical protein